MSFGESSYGWSWNGLRWTHKPVPVNIWYPHLEAMTCESVQAKYKRWAQTPGGRDLDAFVAHFKSCSECGQRLLANKVRDIDDHCTEGAALWAKLETRWRMWLYRLQADQKRGKRLHARGDDGKTTIRAG
jgi:hypothetical protein